MKKHGGSIDKSSFSLLINPFTSVAISDVDYPGHIAAFIGEEPVATFESRFATLLDRKRFRESFNVYANRIEEFSERPYYSHNVTWRKSLVIFKSFFLRHADILSRFSKIRDSFERAVTYGNFGEAECLLDELLDKYGESIWYIRSKILLMSYQGKSKELGEFCDSYIARTKNGFIANIVNCLYAISNSDNSSRFLNKLVASNINELEKAGVNDASSFIRLVFNPFPLIDNAERLACLNYLQVTPLIDQYSLLLELFRRSLSNGKDSSEWRREVERFSRVVSEKIDDWSLKKIADVAAGNSENSLSVVGEHLLQCYEEGNYQEVIDSVGRLLTEAENPIAYVNVVAKSLAYLGCAGFGGVGPFFEIIEDLEKIYRFDGGQEVAEEALISTAVKLNGNPP